VLVASYPTLTGWSLVDFIVPSALVGTQGHLDVVPTPSSIAWNGSSNGPWIRIVPASGVIHALADLDFTNANYQLNSEGQGYATGFPLQDSYRVTLIDVELPTFRVVSAIVRWPETPESWKFNQWLQALGASFGLTVVVASIWILFWYLLARRKDRSIT